MEQVNMMVSNDIVCPVVRSDVTCYWKDMWRRLDAMRRLWQLCDVRLRTDDGSTFMAHSPVLAASSDVLHNMLVANRCIDTGVVPVRGVAPDVLRVTLDFIYGVTPTSRTDFERLRAGAAQLGIDGAYEYCCRRLGEGGITGRRISDSLHNGSDSLSPRQKSVSDESNLSESLHPGAVLKMETMTVNSDGSSVDDDSDPAGQVFMSSASQNVSSPNLANSVPSSLSAPPSLSAPSSDFHHSEMMAQMSFDDLARVDECPHLRRIVGDMMVPPLVDSDSCEGGENDFGDDYDILDGIPLKKHIQKHPSTESMHSSHDQVRSFQQISEVSQMSDGSANAQHTTAHPAPVESSYISLSLASGGGISNSMAPFAKANCHLSNAGYSTRLRPSPMLSSDLELWPSGGSDLIPTSFYSSDDVYSNAVSRKEMQQPQSVQAARSCCSFNASANSCYSASSVSMGKSEVPVSMTGFGMHAHDSYAFGASMFAPDIVSSANMVDPRCGNGIGVMSDVMGMQSPLLLSSGSMQNGKSTSCQKLYPAGYADQTGSGCHSNLNENYGGVNMVDFQIPVGSQTSPVENMMMCKTSATTAGDVSHPLATSGGVSQVTSVPTDDIPVSSAFRTEEAAFISLDDVSAVLKANGFSEKLPSSSAVDRTAMTNEKENINESNGGNETGAASRLCSFCKQRFKTERQLVGHLRSFHTSADGTKTCSICSAQFTSVADFARHLETVHECCIDNDFALALTRLNSNVCYFEDCSYQNPHADALQRHLHQRHSIGQPTLTCPTCSKAYFSIGQLNRHTSRAHSTRVALPETEDTSDVSVSSGGSSATLRCDRLPGLACPDCGERLASPYKLQIHQLRAHNKGKLFSCHHCNFKSPRKKDVQAHMLSQHGTAPPGVRVYLCPTCSYKCIDKNRFEEHEAMHTGIPRYRCTLCPRVYTTRRGLRTHIKYHSSDRPHSCATCGASFKVRSKLADHIKLVHIQKGLKPYECGYCGHATALRGNCNQHIRKSHPGLPLSVIDRLAAQRRMTKDYDYAGITGAGIEEHRDLRAAGWTESRTTLA